MWAEACALLDEAERRHRHFFELLPRLATGPVWEPPANIFALGTEVHVMVALPGARAEDVVAQITPSGLLIEATVPAARLRGRRRGRAAGIPYGRMRRRIELPAGRYTLIEHRLDRGYLFLRLTGSTL